MKNGLTETLELILEKSQGQEISVGEIVKALKYRGFATLLIAPSLLLVLPTGALPGMPLICGLVIVAIAMQAALGKTHPWIPKRLAGYTFSREQYQRAFNKAKPYLDKVDSFFHPRLEFLTHNAMERLVSVLCVVLGGAAIMMGFVPFAAIIPAGAVLLLALGLSVQDGLLVLLGLLATLGASYGAYAIFLGA